MHGAVALLNPLANGGQARALREPVTAWLAAQAPGVPLLVPESPDAAQATLMILAPRTRVVLIGGDGMLHHMLPAALRLGHRVGLVPAGRSNDVARALSLEPQRWQAALAYALHAPSGPVDIGRVEGEDSSHYFAARLVCSAQPKRDAVSPWRIWIDSKPVHDGPAQALWLFNAPRPEGRQRDGVSAPLARLADQRLDAVLLRDGHAPHPHHALRAVPAWLRRMTRWPYHPPHVLRTGCSKVLIDADAPLPLVADGEPLPPAARLLVQLMPRALHLVGGHLLDGTPSASEDVDDAPTRIARDITAYDTPPP